MKRYLYGEKNGKTYYIAICHGTSNSRSEYARDFLHTRYQLCALLYPLKPISYRTY